jgi:hypothetical protein
VSFVSSAPSFAKATAEAMGVDPNTIWRSLRIAEGITEEAVAHLRVWTGLLGVTKGDAGPG